MTFNPKLLSLIAIGGAVCAATNGVLKDSLMSNQYPSIQVNDNPKTTPKEKLHAHSLSNEYVKPVLLKENEINTDELGELDRLRFLDSTTTRTSIYYAKVAYVDTYQNLHDTLATSEIVRTHSSYSDNHPKSQDAYGHRKITETVAFRKNAQTAGFTVVRTEDNDCLYDYDSEKMTTTYSIKRNDNAQKNVKKHDFK